MKHRLTLSSAQISQIEEMSLFKTPMRVIASSLGISKDTLERMVKTNSALRAAIFRGRARSELLSRAMLFNMAMCPGPNQLRATKIWFKNMNAWGDTSEFGRFQGIVEDNENEEPFPKQEIDRFHDLIDEAMKHAPTEDEIEFIYEDFEFLDEIENFDVDSLNERFDLSL